MHKVVSSNEPFTKHWGEFIFGLVGENHQRINLIVGKSLFLNEGVGIL